jgi:integrase
MKVSNKTLSNIQSPLGKALQDAVDDEVIASNPLFDWTYARQEAPKTTSDVDPFTKDEQAAILAELTGQGRNLIQFRIMDLHANVRACCFGLGRYRLQRKIAHVRKARTQGSKKAEKTKTESSTREVKLLRPAHKALIAQKEYTLLAGKEVFQNPPTLERWAGDNPIRQCLWIPAVKRADVRYRRPYQTRHTYASMMLSRRAAYVGCGANGA